MLLNKMAYVTFGPGGGMDYHHCDMTVILDKPGLYFDFPFFFCQLLTGLHVLTGMDDILNCLVIHE